MIKIENISKYFNNIKAIDKVNFEIKKGEVVGLLGPNGAGKTTIMRMISGIYEPTLGKILINGHDTTTDKIKIKRSLGYLAENNNLYNEMTVNEYLWMMILLRDFPKDKRHEILDQSVKDTGLESVYYRPIGELSKGFKQRVGLAQAILGHPELLILDEPTEGLDPNQRVDIRSLISSLGKEKTVILSTHVLSEATEICNRLIILDKGKIIADGAVDKLQAEVSKNYRVHIDIEASSDIDQQDILDIEGINEIISSTELNSRYQYIVLTDASKHTTPALYKLAKKNNWVLWDLHQEKANLENIFRNLTNHE